MTAPLRVTVVAGAGVLGGAELWLLALLRATDRVAVKAVVLAEGPFADELTRLGVPVEVLPAGRRPVDLARAVRRLAYRLRGDRPEIVLANGVKAAVVAAPAAILAGVRCVWAKHDHSFDGRLATLLARLVDGVVATSPTLATASGRPDAVVVPPPRPARPPLPRAAARAVLARSGVSASDHRPVFALVGRLVRYKGLEDAMRALARPGGEGWRVAVIGPTDPAEPGEAERLRRLAVDEGIADRVVFTGPVPDAASLLTGVDAVGVLTKSAGSGPDREGFGTVATEAMLAGVPVVATSDGPVVERLAGRAGLGVPPGDPVAVGTALGWLADPRRRAAMGAAGTELAADHPDAAACAGMLVRELTRVACRPGAGRCDGPPISVVTTVLNESDAVHRLLRRLVGQLTHPDDEVVVVDGGSRDGTVARVRAWAARDHRVRLLVEPGAGISAGRNAGVRAARNALVACTDAGCDPVPGWLAAFRSAAAVDGPARLFTGVYRVTARGPVQAASAAVGYPDPTELRHPSVLVRGYGRLLGRSFDPTLPTGRSMAFGVSVWRAAGGFPEHLATGEDVLFGRAAVAAGVTATMVADAEVLWAQRPSLWATARMYHRYGEGSGRSRDRRLLGRDLARLAAYTVGVPLLWYGGQPARCAVVVAALAYLSLPLARALRRRGGDPGVIPRLAAAAAVPVVAAVRDLAKVTGALRGLWAGRRR
jgi:glycosyltransferase involved in cell wall biosynthesis/GT2 family glycosyltransferase